MHIHSTTSFGFGRLFDSQPRFASFKSFLFFDKGTHHTIQNIEVKDDFHVIGRIYKAMDGRRAMWDGAVAAVTRQRICQDADEGNERMQIRKHAEKEEERTKAKR